MTDKVNDVPAVTVTKQSQKYTMAGSLSDDDVPPIYYNDSDSESGYQTKKQKVKSPNDENLSTCDKVLKVLAKMTLEPFIFLYMFSYLLRGICSKTLVMEKGCRHELNFTEEICSNLSAFPDEKTEVEKIANDYSVYGDLIRFLPATLVVIFMGAWSDKYGRKPPIILAVIGVLVEDIGILLNAVYYNAPLGYFLLASVPAGFSGGFILVLTSTYSLATEMADENFRTFKFALVELGMGLGMSLGLYAGGIMSKYYSYTTIFTTASVGHVLATLWGVFLIAETRGLDSNVGWKKKLSDIFTVEHVLEGFLAAIKKRPNNGRCVIWSLMATLCGIVITYIALADISFIYAYHRYGWDNARFSTVSTVFSTIGIFVGVFCIPLFTRFLKMNDPMLGLTGSISMLAKNILVGLAAKPWLYYIGNIVGLFGGVGPLAVRSYLSKMLNKDELGKVFAFMSACESLIPVAGSLMITKIYNAYVKTSPGAPFFVAAAFLIPSAVTFLWLTFRKSKPYESLPIKASIQNEVNDKKYASL